MQHPDLTSQLARERQARYRADAGSSRMTRLDPDGDGDGNGNGHSRRPGYSRVGVARRSAVLRFVHR